MYALIDANSYYVSSESVFNPAWRGKAMICLSNNDGIVVAANTLAKQAGIRKFKTYVEVKALCELKNVIVCSSNYELYDSLSRSMMEVIGRFAPTQYCYSIDESFLDFNGCDKTITNYHQHGLKIRRAVWKECRLPVSVGFGPTLTLSKIANKLAKTDVTLQGSCVLDTPEQWIPALKATEVSDVWGIGGRLTQRLKFLGVTTAYDLSLLDPKKARKDFSVEVERCIRELNGERCKFWDQTKASKTQIFSTRSVGQRIESLTELQQALSTHVGIASRKARKQNSLCKVLIAFAQNSAYDDGKPQGFRQLHQFEYPTSDVNQITSVVNRIATQFFREGTRYYKIGVGLIDLVDGEHYQADLFNPKPNDTELMKVFDHLNAKYGTDSIFLGAQGIRPAWEMRRSLLTPRYTTKWSDIPKIQC